MTIAIFHPSSELYGADRILVNALKVLPSKINKIVFLRSDGPLIEFLENQVMNVEVRFYPEMPIIHRRMFSLMGGIRLMKQYFKFKKLLKSLVEENDIKTIYFNTLSTSPLILAARKFQVKKLVHVHEIIENPFIVAKYTARISINHANKVVCVSNAVREHLITVSGLNKKREKTKVVHNGIESLDIEAQKKTGPTNFYLFARIMPKKGQWFLLEALNKIPEKILNNSRFVIVGGVLKGSEKYRTELIDQIETFNLQNNVIIKPFTKNISDEMSKADVCIVPSLMADPFPTTVLEAMSAGKPVIATANGGAKEAVIHGKTGFIVQRGDADALAKAITLLIKSPTKIKTMGMAGRIAFLKDFTLKAFEKRWFKIFPL